MNYYDLGRPDLSQSSDGMRAILNGSYADVRRLKWIDCKEILQVGDFWFNTLECAVLSGAIKKYEYIKTLDNADQNNASPWNIFFAAILSDNPQMVDLVFSDFESVWQGLTDIDPEPKYNIYTMLRLAMQTQNEILFIKLISKYLTEDQLVGGLSIIKPGTSNPLIEDQSFRKYFREERSTTSFNVSRPAPYSLLMDSTKISFSWFNRICNMYNLRIRNFRLLGKHIPEKIFKTMEYTPLKGDPIPPPYDINSIVENINSTYKTLSTDLLHYSSKDISQLDRSRTQCIERYGNLERHIKCILYLKSTQLLKQEIELAKGDIKRERNLLSALLNKNHINILCSSNNLALFECYIDWLANMEKSKLFQNLFTENEFCFSAEHLEIVFVEQSPKLIGHFLKLKSTFPNYFKIEVNDILYMIVKYNKTDLFKAELWKDKFNHAGATYITAMERRELEVIKRLHSKLHAPIRLTLVDLCSCTNLELFYHLAELSTENEYQLYINNAYQQYQQYQHYQPSEQLLLTKEIRTKILNEQLENGLTALDARKQVYNSFYSEDSQIHLHYLPPKNKNDDRTCLDDMFPTTVFFKDFTPPPKDPLAFTWNTKPTKVRLYPVKDGGNVISSESKSEPDQNATPVIRDILPVQPIVYPKNPPHMSNEPPKVNQPEYIIVDESVITPDNDLNLFDDELDIIEDQDVFDSDISIIAEVTALNKEKPIQFGIHSKYMSDKPLPRMPAPMYENSKKIENNSALQFCPINLIPQNKKRFSSMAINEHYFKAQLYSLDYLALDTEENWTFVCAGRKENALVPLPEKGRCVLVCTEEESDTLGHYLAPNIDLLVVSHLSGPSHGDYTNLGSITARRVAIFLFTHYCEINEFIMLDDNIKNVQWDKNRIPETSWDGLVQHLKTEVANKGCISVPTLDGHLKGGNHLGSKFFMINMKAISELLKNNIHMFSLFPEAKQAGKWGEDYFFQIYLHNLFKDKNMEGTHRLPRELISLKRSKKHTNSFLKTNKRAEAFDDFEFIDDMPLTLSNHVTETIILLNTLIKENYEIFKTREEELREIDLLAEHAYANHIFDDLMEIDNSLQTKITPFETRFKSAIERYDFKAENYLRPYQIQAIKNVRNLKNQFSRLVLAPGSGKTIIQMTLAMLAFHEASEGQHLFIVIPQIQLVNQFFNDFKSYNASQIQKKSKLAIPISSVITVSSNVSSISARSFVQNNKIGGQKSIILICSNSFEIILKNNKALVNAAPLILFDEYHVYPDLVRDFRDNLEFGNQTMVIGSTATPPQNDCIKETLFSYTLTNALTGKYHAPIVADGLGANYSEENVKRLIKCLPQIIKNQEHPGFMDNGTLDKMKGLIFFESIELCEQAKKTLIENGINAYAINSKNNKSNQEAFDFTKTDEPGVLLAVKKLMYGFDCVDLAWIIIARQPSKKNPSKSTEQEIGRVIRPYEDKIGYILAFDDIKTKYIDPILKMQNKQFSMSCDYLAFDNQFILNEYDVCEVVHAEFADLQPNKLLPAFSIFPTPINNLHGKRPISEVDLDDLKRKKI